MVSGVGPAKELASHNIPLVADLPGVGAHLMDHPVIDINLRDKGKNSLDYIIPRSLKDFIRLCGALAQWVVTGEGPLTCNIGEGLAFIRSSDSELFGTAESSPLPEDTTSGPNAPDIELFVSPVGYQEHGAGEITKNGFAVHGVLLRSFPLSANHHSVSN
jgi:choline dehydrogenase